MRLVCPNCEAKYEVPDDAIPDTGRDVQCTNCGHSWFQMRGRTGATPFVAPAPAEPAPEPVPAPAFEAAEVSAAPVEPPGVVEPEVVPDAVEEAAVEATPAEPAPLQAEHDAAPEGDLIAEAPKAEAASQADAEHAVDSAPVMDADPVVEPVVTILAAEADATPEPAPLSDTVVEAESAAPAEQIIADIVAAEAPAPVTEAAPEAAADDVPAPAPSYAVDDSVLAILREEAEREANARRAEALESQTDLGIDAVMPRKGAAVAEAEAKPAARRDLLPDVEEINSTLRPSEMQADPDETPDFVAPPPEAPRGFRSGFLSLMTVAILAAALYLVAPRLSVMIPALAGPLEGYISIVDSLRLGLDGMMRSATVAISDG